MVLSHTVSLVVFMSLFNVVNDNHNWDSRPSCIHTREQKIKWYSPRFLLFLGPEP